jgi:hypothetical protein
LLVTSTGVACEWAGSDAAAEGRIAFSSQRANYDIYVINADGSGLRRLTLHPTRNPAGSNGDQSPAWSPDGSRSNAGWGMRTPRSTSSTSTEAGCRG